MDTWNILGVGVRGRRQQQRANKAMGAASLYGFAMHIHRP